MVKTCCLKGCTSSWFPDTSISYFKFPLDNERLKKWTKAIEVKSVIGKYSSICSLHFRESDFVYCGPRRKLKKDAIPTQYYNDSEDSFDEDECIQQNQPENIVPKEIERNCYCGNGLNELNQMNVYIQKKVMTKEQEERKNALMRQIKILQSRTRRRNVRLQKVTNILKVFKEKGFKVDDLETN